MAKIHSLCDHCAISKAAIWHRMSTDAQINKVLWVKILGKWGWPL